MTVRTLAEAAAEVLNKTRATAPAESMHTMPHKVVDLGGATWENPEGTDVGTAAASHMGKAEEPGTKPASDTKEGMKKLKGHPEDHEGHAMVDPEHLNGPGVDTAGHGYAHPTMEEGVPPTYNVVHPVHGVIGTHNAAVGFAPSKPHLGFKPSKLVPNGAKIDHDSGPLEEDQDFEESAELSEEELEEAKKAKWAMMKEKMHKMGGMKEDMDALFNGEELSEEFKNKAATIFESAVIARAITVVEEMEAEILAAAEESIEEIKNELEEQVDAYLNYMVEEWVNENQVAIESGLKAEIVEDFMTGLKNLFAEHYIDVPDEKIDILEAMAEENEALEAKLNEALNNNIELSQAIVEATKSEIITSVCEGLTATQAEKVKTLAEGVEFTTEGEYAKKLEIIRENYVSAEPSKVKQSTKQVQLSEQASEPVVPQEVSPVMEHYVRAISRTNPN